MDKNEREGKPAKPSDAYRETILRRYPQINSHIYSNFISNHRSGGRRSPIVSYSEHEIDSFYNSLENMVCYDDYHIVRPAKIKTCFGGTLGYAISHCTESGKKKILMPLFAGTTKQAEDMKSGDLKKETEDKMKKIAKHIKIKIKILWMKYE